MNDGLNALEAALAEHPEPENPMPSARWLAAPRGVLLLGGAWAVTRAMQFRRLFSRTPEAKAAVAPRFVHWWGRYAFRLLGWRLRVEGPRPAPGSVVAPNHFGYIDLIGMAAANGSFFVAQRMMLEMKLFGMIVRAFDHPLTSRNTGREILETAAKMREKLALGQSVTVFLEGTSNPGDRVWEFHNALLQAAIDMGAPVVPAGIVWSATDSRMSIADDVAYWRPEHDLGKHMYRLLGLPPVECVVRFGEPVPSAGKSRKALAAEVRAEVLRLSGLRDAPLRALADRKRVAAQTASAEACTTGATAIVPPRPAPKEPPE
ncbi:MAG: lysophospholipid acyltransferase family protein [Candidatus Sumerlaeia bacterium]|nr:lysophospholipid acyltransferase family protein [Candidatus Sumerlaeia bacterium]